MITHIQLITPRTNIGSGANDGVYYPTGLLTIASRIIKTYPQIVVYIDDQNVSEISIREDVQVVGISIPSPLCYQNVLTIASKAKEMNKIVVVGGPYVTTTYKNIMQYQPTIDFAIRGKGENAFKEVITELNSFSKFYKIDGLCWRKKGEIIHNSSKTKPWNYDDYIPLPLHLLTAGIKKYWQNFNIAYKTQDVSFFQVFTHFGCTWQDVASKKRCNKQFPYCSFCALQDDVHTRKAKLIISEIQAYVSEFRIPKGTNIVLKDYGDNIGGHKKLLIALDDAISKCSWWGDYKFTWIMYCQSGFLTEEIGDLLNRIGCFHLFIGFDSANDELQRVNGMGTNRKAHEQAIRVCQKYRISIQAASVVGVAGETSETLEETFLFFKQMCEMGIVERVNSAILFLVPGSPAWKALEKMVPTINDTDLFSTTGLRNLWIEHFCPQIKLELLKKYANKIDGLSPGVHASMGYVSDLSKRQ